MHKGQPNSFARSFWNTAATVLLIASVSGLTACADPVQKAAELGALAQQSLEAGDIPEARKRIAAALAERDDLPELHLLRGRIELAAEADNRSFAAYSNALSLDNSNIEALQAVSQLGLRTGNIRESQDAAERLLALSPNDANALVVRGVHAFLQRRFDEAVDYADRALVQAPDHEGATILKSRSLFVAGKPDEAFEAVNSLPPGAAATAGIYRTKLELAREMRDAAAMQEQFDNLFKAVPEDMSVRIDAADLRFKLGARDAGRGIITGVLASKDLDADTAREAISALEAYDTTLTPDQVRRVAMNGSTAAKAELARALMAEDQARLAQALVESLPPGEAAPLSARLALSNNQPKVALRLSEEVLADDETDCDALVAAAGALLTLDKPPSALRRAQRAAAECPAREEGWLLNAAAYSALKRPVNVERVYRDALEANPQSLRITTTFADWLVARNRVREAQAVARILTRKSPALLRGWALYRSLCAKPGSDCEAEAARGFEDAKTRFGPDPAVGKIPPSGLFGRLVRR